jgi:hypothetical protein
MPARRTNGHQLGCCSGCVDEDCVPVQAVWADSSHRVGIGGGVPSEEGDIKFGNVVVSKLHNMHGGVVLYEPSRLLQAGLSGLDYLISR